MKVGFYMDGAEKKGKGKAMASINPANDEVIAEVTGCSNEDVNDAVESAKEGFKAWSSMTGSERGRIMMKYYTMHNLDCGFTLQSDEKC